MRWFKHKTDASRNPLMRKAVAEHGTEAIAIWYVFLEEMCRWGRQEPTKPRSRVMTWRAEIDVQQIALSCAQELQKTVFTLRSLIVLFGVTLEKENYLWTVSYPKIIEIKDEYTRKSVRTNSGQCPDNVPLEEEQEQEVDLKKDLRTPHPCRGASSDQTDTPEKLQVLKEVCDRVQQRTGFNAYEFVVKKNREKRGKGPWPAECFIEVLEKFLDGKDVQKPWPYLESIWKVHAPNVLERMSTEKSDAFKDMDVGDVLRGVGL